MPQKYVITVCGIIFSGIVALNRLHIDLRFPYLRFFCFFFFFQTNREGCVVLDPDHFYYSSSRDKVTLDATVQRGNFERLMEYSNVRREATRSFWTSEAENINKRGD